MTSVFISVLNMSAIASVVAVAVIIARIPLRKAPKIFSQWAVVFLRLVCPLNFESPASLMPVIPEIIPQTVMSEIPISGIPAPEISQIDENPAPQVNLEESVNPIWVALYIGTGVWLLGISILLIYAVVGYIRLRHQVYDATVEDGVYRTDKIYTAFVLGFIRPKIYIPLNIKGAQLDHIIKHERVHIKRFL